MPATGHGLVYPTSSAIVEPWVDLQNFADSAEAALDAYETWNSWTLVWTVGFTSYGAGSVVEAFYSQIGKLVHAEFRVQLGTSPTADANFFTLTLPVLAFAWSGGALQPSIGVWNIRDNSAVKHYSGTIGTLSTANGCTFSGALDGTFDTVRVTNVLPITWAVDDVFSGVLDYRAA